MYRQQATGNRQQATGNRQQADTTKWKEVWERKGNDLIRKNQTYEDIFLELKRLDGFDSVGDGVSLTFNSFKQQYIQLKNELSFCSLGVKEIHSVFEIGCGSGANLYLFEHDGIKTGGIDYSSSLIKVAGETLSRLNTIELICGEVVKTPVDIVYDASFSNSVFSYFPSYDYAAEVLELMYKKSRYSIGIIDVHDINLKDKFLKYREDAVEDYSVKYAGLDKQFYDREFFMNFAEKHRLNIKFTYSNIPGYWNNDFVFDVFITKEF